VIDIVPERPLVGSRYPALAMGLLILCGVASLASILLFGFSRIDTAVAAILILAAGLTLGATVFSRPLLVTLSLYVLLLPAEGILATQFGGVEKLIALATAFVALILLIDRRMIVSPPPAVYAWGAFIACVVASLLWTINLALSVEEVLELVQLYVFYVLLSMIRMRLRDVALLAFVTAIAGTGAAIYAVVSYHTGQNMVAGHGTIARFFPTINGRILDPNFYAASLIAPVAFALVFALRERSMLKWLSLSALLIMMGGMFATGSRGGFVAISAMWLYVLLMHRHKIQSLILGGIGLLATVPFPGLWARVFDPGQGDAGGRFEVWKVALASMRTHPILGTGAGTFRDAYVHALFSSFSAPGSFMIVKECHDVLVKSAVEYGGLGIAVFAVALWFQWRTLSRVSRDGLVGELRVAIEAASIGIALSALTLDLLEHKLLWMIFIYAAILRAAVLVRPGARSHVLR